MMAAWTTCGPTFPIVVRSTRRGPLALPTKPGGMTWCSGHVFQMDDDSSSPDNGGPSPGLVIDVLLDTNTTHAGASADDGSSAQQSNSSAGGGGGARLYSFVCQRTSQLTTRAGALVLHATTFLGAVAAPPDDDAPDDPSLHKVEKGERAKIFAAWLLEKFGAQVLCAGSGVVDVAAGRGDLSAELLQQCPSGHSDLWPTL